MNCGVNAATRTTIHDSHYHVKSESRFLYGECHMARICTEQGSHAKSWLNTKFRATFISEHYSEFELLMDKGFPLAYLQL